jgi:hypothetical protein
MFNHRKTREYTCMLHDLMDEGTLDPRSVAEMCLVYMSEDDVKDMCRNNDILPYGEEEYDGQPDEAQEWADFDPDC